MKSSVITLVLVGGIRHVIADFNAVVPPHAGHYPMLECPEEFNRGLKETLRGLAIA